MQHTHTECYVPPTSDGTYAYVIYVLLVHFSFWSVHSAAGIATEQRSNKQAEGT